MIVTNVRKKSLTKRGVRYTNMKGTGEYNFIHLFDPITILVNGTNVTTKRNAILIYGPQSPQAMDCNMGDVYFERFSFTGDSVEQLLDLYGLSSDKIYYPSESCTKDILRLFECIDDEFFRPRKFAGNAVRIYAEQIFLSLCRDVNSDSPEYNDKIINTFCEIRKAIYSHPQKDWNVDDMAQAANLNKARFFELYKKLFGISPIQDIISLRIRIAKTLLGTHRYTVAEVAEITGYQNVFHFIRQFKKHTNITPKQFEKQN